MDSYLIAISVGPVQDFIASARRTRDLWYGSELLSRICKHIAYSLHSQNAKLIFPSPVNPESELLDTSPLNVGNKILAIIDSEKPAETVAMLKQSAVNKLMEIASEIKAKIIEEYDCKSEVNWNMWDEQLKDVLEIYSTWIKIENAALYDKYRKRLDTLLAARKNTREFNQSGIDGRAIPKSSLDGLRESVIYTTIKPWKRQKLGLSNSECLDAIGLIKRVGGLDRDQFTPISRIAVDSWLQSLLPKFRSEFSEISELLKPLVKHSLVSKVSGNGGIYNEFKFDSQLLFPFRLQVIGSEVERMYREDPRKKQQVLSQIELLKEKIKKSKIYQCGKPTPYVAVIHADGDRMGELLDEKKTIDSHQQVSLELTSFATKVPELVRKYRGDTIYSGGDDVLALLPMTNAINCAHELKELFESTIKPGEKIRATLSVGIAIGHILEPMSRLINLSRQAEVLAKGNDLEEGKRKNALGIILKPRSGAPVEIRSQWAENPQEFLNTWCSAHMNNEIPDGAAYELRRLNNELSWIDKNNEDERELLSLEAQRVLKRKKARHGKDELSTKIIRDIEQRISQVGLHGLASELILTRRIAEAETLIEKNRGEK